MELPHSIICFADRAAGNPFLLQIAGPEAEETSARLPSVLVVDDERLLADTTATILRRSGFNTKTAYDGFAALEMTRSFHPDYLLTDIMMPVMNGIELAITITKMYPATKILLISGQAGISDMLEDSKAKGYEFPLLAKPVHPAKLIEGLISLKND